MKASELRIGNFVYQEQTIDDLEIVEAGLGTLVNALCLKPIPLKEEWLVKFGFEVDTWGQFILDLNYRNLNGRLMYSDFCTMSVFSDFSDGHKEDYTFQRDVIYVHQLQNLYFALTGKELTIKE